MVSDPLSASREQRRERGRPPTAMRDRQLFIELRRLTGCGARGMVNAINRMRMDRALPWLTAPTESSLKRAFSEGHLPERLNRPLQPTTLPGWCAVHVVPVLVEDDEPWDLTLLWEPYSTAVLGTMARHSDDAADDMAQSIANSLQRLPPGFVETISEIRLTTPRCRSGFFHWFAAANRTAALDLQIVTEAGRELAIKNDPPTKMYYSVDLRPHIDGGGYGNARKMLLRALDVHNLTKKNEVDTDRFSSMVRAGVYDPKNSDFVPALFRPAPRSSSPQERLARAPTAPDRRLENQEVRALLNYRSSDKKR